VGTVRLQEDHVFRTAEVGRKVSKSDYEAALPALRVELIELQQQLRQADFPVIVLFAGVDGAGKGGTVNLLNEWMDPRWLQTRAYGEPSDEERERPEFWRYWRDLPPKGRIGLVLSAWYSRPVLDRVNGRQEDGEFDRDLDRIIAFEELLADDGAVILKFWMHLGKKAQKRRLTSLEKDPLTSWRVTKTDWDHWKKYDRFVDAAERLVMRTSRAHAPWTIVEGEDERYRSLAVGRRLRDAIRARFDAESAARESAASAPSGVPVDVVDESLEPAFERTVFSTLDMDAAVDEKAYDRRLPKAQARLNRAYRRARDARRSTVMVFEGWDAGGKGGAIRRLTAAMDARDYQVIPIAAPTDEERARPYLWRFWRQLGRAGRVTVYDRSWYGRVLVERVEGLARPEEWQRAFAEINDFERQLVEFGTIVIKFWLHLTADEQLRRFERRQEIPFKRWKLTDEDWRNRERWPEYEQAAHQMIGQTSTSLAPWYLVPANSKRFARLAVLDTVCDALEEALKD